MVRAVTGAGWRILFSVRASSAFVQGPRIDSAAGAGHLLRPVVTRWRENVFNQRLPHTIYRYFHRRSSKLGQAKLVEGPEAGGSQGLDVQVPGAAAPTGASLGAIRGGTQYHIYMKMHFPDAKTEQYGITQEFGREEKTRSGGGYYFVPIAAKFNREGKIVNQRTIGAELKKSNVVMAPGKGKWGRDSEGRRVKYVFQLGRSTPKGKSGQKSIGGGKSAKIEEQRELLFLAYPDDIPAIPGRKAGKFAKGRLTSKQPLVTKYGFTAGTGQGRWFQKHLAITVPRLHEMLFNAKNMRLFRGAIGRNVMGTGKGRQAEIASLIQSQIEDSQSDLTGY